MNCIGCGVDVEPAQKQVNARRRSDPADFIAGRTETGRSLRTLRAFNAEGEKQWQLQQQKRNTD
jgi:hypothetical protein